MLRHLDPCLMDPLRHGLAAAEKYRAKEKIPGEQKVNGAPHSFNEHPFMQLCAGRNCNLRTCRNSKFDFEVRQRERMTFVLRHLPFTDH